MQVLCVFFEDEDYSGLAIAESTDKAFTKSDDPLVLSAAELKTKPEFILILRPDVLGRSLFKTTK